MADETPYGTYGYTSIIRWIDPTIDIDSYTIQRVLSVGSDTAVAMDVVTAEGETQGLVDLAAEADAIGPLGIILGPTVPPEDYDLDDTIADGETVNILRPTGGRTIVSLLMDSDAGAASFEEGDYVRFGSSAGHVQGWVYGDNADGTDTMYQVLGKFAEVVTQSATDDIIVRVWY
jgi:hypothetical protein